MAASTDAESQSSDDVNSVRDAAKWLLTAFAAVGAALLGGIQFSGLGALKDGALISGIGGFLIGLFGVGLAIWWTSSVLVTRIVSVTPLQTDPEAVRFLDANSDIVGQEYQSFGGFIRAREAAWAEWKAGRRPNTTDSQWAQVQVRLEHVEKVATRVARIWRFEKICRAFIRARALTFAGAVIAAIGMLLLTHATKAKDQEYSAKSPSAVAVTYAFRPEAYQSLLEQIKADCLPSKGIATILDGWPGGSDVLIISDLTRCPPLRLRWDDTLGTLMAIQSASASSVPSPQATRPAPPAH
jgi:hypothetical protein